MTLTDGVVERLFRPVDIAWLVFFRVAFGLLMFEEALRYLVLGLGRGLYIEPPFHFTYYGFSWVQPWPGEWMYVHFAALALLGLCVAIGLFYRIAATLFFFGFTFVFLLDQARYLNHFYLVALLSFLLIFLPAHRSFSLDARRKPSLRTAVVPLWTLFLVRAQIGIVYVYAAIAKLNVDWLRGEPLRMWLYERREMRVIGPILEWPTLPWLMSYGAILLDLFCVPFLLWRRTRVVAFLFVVLFHAMNFVLFSIGVFPWLMLAATLLFFDADWPRRLLTRWRKKKSVSHPGREEPPPPVSPSSRRLVVLAVSLFLAVQVLVPLRHLLYPGDVNWTEEGHRFSWRMKLRSKHGWSAFTVRDPRTGREWTVTVDGLIDRRPWKLHVSGDPWPDNVHVPYLTPRQARKMAGLPDMVLQFAHHLAGLFDEGGYSDVEVRARVKTSLNGRPEQLLVDPEVDLAKESRSLRPASWILPLRTPLP